MICFLLWELRINTVLLNIKKTDFQAKALTIEGPHKLRPNKFKKKGPKEFLGMVAISRMTIRLKVTIKVEGNVGYVKA